MRDAATFDPPEAVALAIRTQSGRRQLAVFLDFDGTLTPIVDRPDAARLAPSMSAALEQLARTAVLAVLTGRSLVDIRTRIALPGVILAGAHGYEIEGGLPAPPFAQAQEVMRIEAAAGRLHETLRTLPGVMIEPKRFALAVHWRHVDPSLVPLVEAAVDAVSAAVGGLRKTHGQCVFELRPDLPWDKGRALLWILRTLPGPLFPVFIGDDITDLDALAAVRDIGIGVSVGPILSPEAAAFHLADPAAVERLLRALATVPPAP